MLTLHSENGSDSGDSPYNFDGGDGEYEAQEHDEDDLDSHLVWYPVYQVVGEHVDPDYVEYVYGK